MVNSQVTAEIVDTLKLDLNVDKIPAAIPVIEVNPKQVGKGLIKVTTRTTSGGVTIITTPAKQKFYLTNIFFSFVKNAACDVATGTLQVNTTIGGIAYSIVDVPVLTLTAERDSFNIPFKNPLLIDKNVTISIGNNTFTAGLMIRNATLSYFVDEVN